MHRTIRTLALALKTAAATALLAACATTPSSGPMGFFLTSAGPGDGANLGGLAGADAHCQKLAATAGAGAPRTSSRRGLMPLMAMEKQ